MENSEREIIFDTKRNTPVLQAPSASSRVQASGEAEERKTSEPMALAGKESTDTELADRENEETNSVYLTESSGNEDTTMAATAGDVPSKESAKEQEIQEHENKAINLFYVLAGVLAVFGGFRVIKKKR